MKRIFACTSLFIVFSFIFSTGDSRAQSSKKTLVAGDTVPRFSLTDQDGRPFNVADYLGKKVMVIYFYPKDESMVCTKEACAFRDSFDQFKKAGAMVIAINGGTVASHKSFQQHYKLPFVLLSDPGNKVYNLFGIKNKMFMPGRVTFVVGLNGKIVYVHEAMMQGKEHADDALNYIKAAKTK